MEVNADFVAVGDAGTAGTDLLKTVEAGIAKAEGLLREYERHLEGCLHQIADEADRGRLLFLEVAQRMFEFQALVGEHGQELTQEELVQWEGLLDDYRKLRREWVGKLPPEECPPYLE